MTGSADTAPAAPAKKQPRRWGAIMIGVLLLLIGLWLAAGGGWLISLGGSAYYLIAGIGCLISGWLYVKGSRLAMPAYLVVFLGSCIWAFAEVGSEFWELLPRLAGPLVFAVVAVLHTLWSRQGGRKLALAATVVALLAAAGSFVGLRHIPALPDASGQGFAPLATGTQDDWVSFGRAPGGSRFSPAAQITPANVADLEPAWTFRTGDKPLPGGIPAYVFEATPIKIGDMLYFCTSSNQIIALDVDSGKQRWRFDTKASSAGVRLSACRGVSHFQAPEGTACASRILAPTRDARMWAIDAVTGKPCEGFGDKGQISLLADLGDVPEGFVSNTSPPVVINGVIVIGGFVLDGAEVGEPSGAIRGFDAITGKLLWAWDPGAEDENPKPGVHYARGSPNSWSVSSGDPELGLVYVPMGNATPDYVNQHRTKLNDRYASAVVALDARTGARRWAFRTVHNDIWDYDIGSQPVLFDMPMPNGATVPALAAPTKHGDIYILDRRTGVPLTEVTERKVPKGSIPKETYSPTQPFSTGFPTLSPPDLTEADMWGATPLDQLWCRIKFRSLDYRGKFTPPSIKGSLQYPGNFGVIDWGSVAIDEKRGLMVVNSSNLPLVVRLVPRDKLTAKDEANHGSYSPQKGTPYAADPQNFMSPLGLPCHAPPWGRLTGIDLKARKIAWQHSLGTTKDVAPFGIAVPGTFNIGGSTATAGGVTFVGATIDNYLRAFDTKTGKELWRGRLPAGGQAGVMTYVSEKTGRQYVVIAAGGHQFMQTTLGDYVKAYALPLPKKD